MSAQSSSERRLCRVTKHFELAMSEEPLKSLSDEATVAGRAPAPRSEVSLGDERTLGDGLSSQDTVIDEIEVVDLEARYRIEGELGQGGMGAVLLATDTRLGRKVAVKRILGDAAGNRLAAARFLTEAKAIAALNHPNIVQIYDYGRAADGPFLIMEYVDGGSLLDRCKAGPIPLDEAIDLACQICDGLAKAHDRQIIHRDIKPANVLLTKDGTPKLTDFGLAKATAGDHGHSITGSGAFLGTPDFMPPEQRRDAALVDHRSDLWSLAATVYQMVTARSPKIIRFDLLRAELTKVLGKALEESKEERYQTAKDFRDALRAARAGDHKSAVPSSLAGVIQEGQCKVCGTVTTDITKKFCRNPRCGASLRVPCLKCDARIPVWDGVCGECGGNQPELLEGLQADFSVKRSQAESFAQAYDFTRAIRLAEEISARDHAALAGFTDWAKVFVADTTAEKQRQAVISAERLLEAQKHAAAYDYPAAIQTLELVPLPLRDGKAGSLLEQCLARKQESDALITTIAGRIQHKQIDGLLPLVQRAAELRGDRKDLRKIHGQLSSRRDDRVSRSQAAMDAGDAATAAGALADVSAEDLGDKASFRDHVNEAAAAERRLLAFVKEAKCDGVVSVGEAERIVELGQECLALHPENVKAQVLVQQSRGIIEKHRQRDRKERVRQATQQVLAMPPFRNSIGMQLKLLPAGTFTMGQRWGETPHEVTLTKAFCIGVYEVTNAQWQRVMGSAPSQWKNDDHPVERVSWQEAVIFCQKLSAMPAEREAGREYRLPTEAEWEYACRAGTSTEYTFGDDESTLEEYAWYARNAGGQTQAVGKKRPNAWGLYDMHGNVYEWCSDWHADYANGAVTDPQGPVEGGGCWGSSAGNCRSANRRRNDAWRRYTDLGFRLALTPPAGQPVPPEAAAGR